MKRVIQISVGALLLLPFAGAQVAPPAAGGRGGGPPLPFKIDVLDPGLNDLIDPDTKLETVVTIPGLSSEGPMWREGKIWFSDQKGGNMYAVTLDGEVTTLAENVGGKVDLGAGYNQGPNAQVTDKDGSVLVCRQIIRDIGRYNPDGTFSEFLSRYEGKRFNCPNDMVFGPDGALWFTDPDFSLPGARSGGTPPADSQWPIQGVYRYKDGKLRRVISDITRPNGIGLSPDGKTLYVNSGSPAPHINAYDVAADGSLSNVRVLSDYGITPGSGLRGGVDGLKVDSKGNVWTTGPGGVTVVSPAGKVLGRIQLPQGPSNVAFGGSDYKSVFFMSGATVYRLQLRAAGLKPIYARP